MQEEKSLYKIINEYYARYFPESETEYSEETRKELEDRFEAVFQSILSLESLIVEYPNDEIEVLEKAENYAFTRFGQITYRAMKNQAVVMKNRKEEKNEQ